MKKLLAMLLTLTLLFAFVACNSNDEPKFDPSAKGEGTMTYAEYAAAAIDAPVVIEAFVQGNQSWWFDSDAGHGKITVYAQDPDGAYFIYEMKCAEEDAAKITKGAKIKVTGFKAEWSGEVEIVDATFEVLDGTWVAEATDVTELLGKEELINKQNMLVSFKGLTVEGISYKDSEWDPDIYLAVNYNGASYSFCVENYLCGPDTDVYKTVAALEAGDKIDVEGFLYWYEGVNTHITAVTVAE